MGIARILANNAALEDMDKERQRLLEAERVVAERDAEIARLGAAVAVLNEKLAVVLASNDDLAKMLALLRAKIAGRKSERFVDEEQSEALPFVPKPLTPPPTKPEPEPAESKPNNKRKPRRRNLAERDDMETRPLHSAVDESKCPRCDGDLKQIHPAVSYRVGWVMGHFTRIKVEREQCSCPKCPGAGVVVAPEPPFALPRALCDNTLLARVIIDKFEDHLPLNRQVHRMEREGFDVSTSTLSDWVAASADVLEPIALAIEKRLLASPWLQGDDTGFPVQDGLDGCLRKGRMWAYTDQQEVRYLFTGTKAGHEPATFLAGFTGSLLLVDCGSEFNEVVRQRGLVRAGCLAHLRRYFNDARLHHPIEAAAALVTFRDLFAIEDALRDADDDLVREVRDRDSRPLVNGLFTWVRGLSTHVRPKSQLGAAVGYALNNEPAFRVFLDHPEIPMHNNLSELQLRQHVVGRKNWMFAGAAGGAHAAAIHDTLIGSCRLQRIDPWEYLVDVLGRLADATAHELTPRAWRHAREPKKRAP